MDDIFCDSDPSVALLSEFGRDHCQTLPGRPARQIKDYMDLGTPGVLKYVTETGPEHCDVPCRRDPCNP